MNKLRSELDSLMVVINMRIVEAKDSEDYDILESQLNQAMGLARMLSRRLGYLQLSHLRFKQ